jgi:hypothetical protein
MLCLQEILGQVYALEQNVSLSCFWDGDWRVRLGDDTNGYTDEWDGPLEECRIWLAGKLQEMQRRERLRVLDIKV